MMTLPGLDVPQPWWPKGAQTAEEATILERSNGRDAWIAEPGRQAAALRLMRRGLVTVREGFGRDAGLIVVSRTTSQ